MKISLLKRLTPIILISLLLVSGELSAKAETGEFQNATPTSAYAIAVEGEFVYIAGDASDLAAQLPAGSLDLSGGMEDIWLVKLRSDGTAVYQALIGGSNDDTAYDLVVRQGVVYLLGETWSDDFPSAPGIAGEDDAVLLALAADGSQILWARRFGGSDQDSGRALSLQGDSLYLSGITWSQDFISGAAKGDADGFLARVDLSGGLQWLQVFGGRGFDAPFALAVNPDGVWLAGQTFSNNFGEAYQGGSDAFAARFSLNGEQQFVRLYGGREDDMANAIALTADGGAYLTGGTQSTRFSAAKGTFAGGIDSFVIKTGADGVQQNAAYLGGSGNDVGYALSVLSGGDALMVGNTNSPLFPLGFANAASSLGKEDAFIVRVNPAAEPVTVWLKGNAEDQRPLRSAMVPQGLWLAGRFNGGSPPYALFVPAVDLQGIVFPTPFSPLPTATLAKTATFQPTETPVPTATNTQLPGTTLTTENSVTVTATAAGTDAEIKITATSEVVIGEDPGPSLTPTLKAIQPAAAPETQEKTQGAAVPVSVWLGGGLILIAALAGVFYQFVWKKKEDNSKE